MRATVCLAVASAWFAAVLVCSSSARGAESQDSHKQRDCPDFPARKVITVCGRRLELMTADEVRALGFPWTDVADDQNAATYYIDGANKLHELPPNHVADEQETHARENAWDDSMKELAAALEAAKPALDSYRKGASMKLSQPPFGKAQMLAAMLLPDLAAARRAARLFLADARRLEAKASFKDAIDNYLTVMRIGEHYGAGRTLIDHLVGIACIRMAQGDAFKGMCRRAYPRDELRRFVKELDGLRPGLPNIARALQCEKAFDLGTLDDIMRLGPQSVTAMGQAGEQRELSPLEARLLRVLLPDRTMRKDLTRFYDRGIESARKPFYALEPREAPDRLAAECKPWNFFAQLLLPALGRVRISTEEMRAEFDLLRLAVALKLYQQEMGAYPDRLDWLVKDNYIAEVPTDPFSGKPILYKVKDGEFTVYSVGSDGRDDGGQVGRPDDGTKPADIGFSSKLLALKPYVRRAGE